MHVSSSLHPISLTISSPFLFMSHRTTNEGKSCGIGMAQFFSITIILLSERARGDSWRLLSWKRDYWVVGGGDYHLEVVSDLVYVFGYGNALVGLAVSAVAWDMN